MFNSVLRGCLRTLLSSSRPTVQSSTVYSQRYCSQRITKQLSNIDKNQEIKGYFVEDFNVKGRAVWGVWTITASTGIVYLSLSIVAGIGSYYLLYSPYAVDLASDLNLMDLVSRFVIDDDTNPRSILAFMLYLVTEPARIYIAFKSRLPVRNFLYQNKFFKDTKYRPFKNEGAYDEQKIGRF